MDSKFTALHRRIISLSFDPYLLTDATLRRIATIEEMLTDAAASEKANDLLDELCKVSADRIKQESAAARLKVAKRKKELLSHYDRLLERISRLTSTELLQETSTVWFTRPEADKRKVLISEIRALASECEEAQNALIGIADLQKSKYASDTLQEEILSLKIGAMLCAEHLKSTDQEKLDKLSSSVKKLEAYERSSDRLKSIGIRLSVELLPPFLEFLYSLLKDDTATHLEVSDVRLLLSEVQAFRERLRLAVEPLMKKRTGGTKI